MLASAIWPATADGLPAELEQAIARDCDGRRDLASAARQLTERYGRSVSPPPCPIRPTAPPTSRYAFPPPTPRLPGARPCAGGAAGRALRIVSISEPAPARRLGRGGPSLGTVTCVRRSAAFAAVGQRLGGRVGEPRGARRALVAATSVTARSQRDVVVLSCVSARSQAQVNRSSARRGAKPARCWCWSRQHARMLPPRARHARALLAGGARLVTPCPTENLSHARHRRLVPPQRASAHRRARRLRSARSAPRTRNQLPAAAKQRSRCPTRASCASRSFTRTHAPDAVPANDRADHGGQVAEVALALRAPARLGRRLGAGCARGIAKMRMGPPRRLSALAIGCLQHAAQRMLIPAGEIRHLFRLSGGNCVRISAAYCHGCARASSWPRHCRDRSRKTAPARAPRTP